MNCWLWAVKDTGCWSGGRQCASKHPPVHMTNFDVNFRTGLVLWISQYQQMIMQKFITSKSFYLLCRIFMLQISKLVLLGVGNAHSSTHMINFRWVHMHLEYQYCNIHDTLSETWLLAIILTHCIGFHCWMVSNQYCKCWYYATTWDFNSEHVFSGNLCVLCYSENLDVYIFQYAPMHI